MIEPSLRLEGEYRGIEAKQGPLIRKLNSRAEGVRKEDTKTSQQKHLEERARFWRRVLDSRGNLDTQRAHLRKMKQEAYNSDESIRDEFIRAYESYARRYGYIYR